MPTINFMLSDLSRLAGKKISVEQLHELLLYCKAEVSSYDKTTDDVSVSLDDTNLPYLWSAEGLARLIRGILGIETGFKELKTEKSEKSNYEIIVHESVRNVRPYTMAFVAKWKKVDEYLLKQMIQLQEKITENYGRRRHKLGMGVYKNSMIKYPIHYKAVNPKSAKIMPLGFNEMMYLDEVLEKHPKGKEYSWILHPHSLYPVFEDSSGKILALFPITNSNDTGRIEPNDDELFVEATGNDEESIKLASCIFAQALADRGFKIFDVTVRYVKHEGKTGKSIKLIKTVKSPATQPSKIKFSSEKVEKMLGIKLDEKQISQLLAKARLGYDIKSKQALIPPWRGDVMHEVDIIEDIAIMYGFDNIKGEELKSYTVGSILPINSFCNTLREICVGIGMQETFSHMLTSKEIMCAKTKANDLECVEIDEYMSETYSALRSWLVPILLEVLSKNKHRSYPQNIFEQGTITKLTGGKISDKESLAVALCNNDTDFTAIKQVADAIIRVLGLRAEFSNVEHPSFISGRSAEIYVEGKKIGIIGEIGPEVLANFDLETPVTCLELDVSELLRLQSFEKK